MKQDLKSRLRRTTFIFSVLHSKVALSCLSSSFSFVLIIVSYDFCREIFRSISCKNLNGSQAFPSHSSSSHSSLTSYFSLSQSSLLSAVVIERKSKHVP